MSPTITTMSIALGPQGTQETLRIMAALVRAAADDNVFREFASQYRTPAEVDLMLRIVYTYIEEPIETLYAPQYNLSHLYQFGSIIGDCDDISMFYAAVFTVIGIRTRFVAMRTRRNDPEFYHVVVEDLDSQRRYDATVPPNMVYQMIDYGKMVQYV